MANGHHLLFLPITYSAIIPIFISVLGVGIFGNFWSSMLFVLGVCLMIWNMIEFWRIFIHRKGNVNKMKNGIRAKNIVKTILIISLSIFVAVSSVNIIIDELFLKNEQIGFDDERIKNIKEISKNIYNIGLASLTSLILAFIPAVAIVMNPKYYFGLSCIYFRIGLEETNYIEKNARYQKGLDAYNHYLLETIGLKLKYFTEILSKISVEEPSLVDKKVVSIQENVEDPIYFAKILNLWIGIRSEEMLVQQSQFENIEKWSKFLSIPIPIISFIITYILK